MVDGNKQYFVQNISQKMYKVKRKEKRKKNKLRKKTTWISALRTGKGFLNNEQIQKTILIHLAKLI